MAGSDYEDIVKDSESIFKELKENITKEVKKIIDKAEQKISKKVEEIHKDLDEKATEQKMIDDLARPYKTLSKDNYKKEKQLLEKEINKDLVYLKMLREKYQQLSSKKPNENNRLYHVEVNQINSEKSRINRLISFYEYELELYQKIHTAILQPSFRTNKN